MNLLSKGKNISSVLVMFIPVIYIVLSLRFSFPDPPQTISAADLYRAYAQDSQSADARYADKTIRVEGKLVDMIVDDDQQYILMLESSSPSYHVQCRMNTYFSAHEKPAIGSVVIISGDCEGRWVDIILKDGRIEHVKVDL